MCVLCLGTLYQRYMLNALQYVCALYSLLCGLQTLNCRPVQRSRVVELGCTDPYSGCVLRSSGSPSAICGGGCCSRLRCLLSIVGPMGQLCVGTADGPWQWLCRLQSTTELRESACQWQPA